MMWGTLCEMFDNDNTDILLDPLIQ